MILTLLLLLDSAFNKKFDKSTGFSKYHRVGFYVRCLGWAQEELWNYSSLYDCNADTLSLVLGTVAARSEKLEAQDMSTKALARYMYSDTHGVAKHTKKVDMNQYDGVFICKEAVDWMLEKLSVAGRSQAVDLGNQLKIRGYIRHPVVMDKTFKDDSTPFVFTDIIIGDEEEVEDVWSQINLKVLDADPNVQRELEAMKKNRRKRKNSERRALAGGTGAGAAVGAVVGVVGGPLGMMVGAAVGGAVGGACATAYNRGKRKKEAVGKKEKAEKH